MHVPACCPLKKINVTFTKNLFHKEPGLMGYDPLLLGDPLKQWELVAHWHSDISHKTWVFSNTAVRILSSMTVRTKNLSILYIVLCYIVFCDPNPQYLPVVGWFCIKEQSQIFPDILREEFVECWNFCVIILFWGKLTRYRHTLHNTEFHRENICRVRILFIFPTDAHYYKIM
jgi:hypothetical protein